MTGLACTAPFLPPTAVIWAHQAALHATSGVMLASYWRPVGVLFASYARLFVMVLARDWCYHAVMQQSTGQVVNGCEVAR